MERSLNSILASKTLRVRKYAAKFRLADHAGARQCLYLRFLGVKRAVWSAVPKFAAYFRFVLMEVRGKTELCRPDPGFALPRPAVLLSKLGLCSAGSDFSPHFRKSGISIPMFRLQMRLIQQRESTFLSSVRALSSVV